jgi:hypothetical protein
VKGILLLDAARSRTLSPRISRRRRSSLRLQETSWMIRQQFPVGQGHREAQRWNIGAAVEGLSWPMARMASVLVYSMPTCSPTSACRTSSARQRRSSCRVRSMIDPLARRRRSVAGDIVSEEDTAIQHTKNETAVWFFLTVIGAVRRSDRAVFTPTSGAAGHPQEASSGQPANQGRREKH